MFTAHCSYRLKFHLRNSSFNNRRLPGTRFARSTRPSQRSKYTEGVAQRMRRCVAIQRPSRKCVQKKKKKKKQTPYGGAVADLGG